jgi:hypothetical protein
MQITVVQRYAIAFRQYLVLNDEETFAYDSFKEQDIPQGLLSLPAGNFSLY